MQDLKKIRFVATNYSNLQGLRAIPLGLCLLAVCWWAAHLHYPARPVDFINGNFHSFLYRLGRGAGLVAEFGVKPDEYGVLTC